MNIAYTMLPGRGDTDLLLAALARRLQMSGLRVCGSVQSNHERPGDHPCDMNIHVLPDGPVLRISQALGSGSKGCRLDPSVLEQAAQQVETRLSDGADVLIINKFGKHEAQGRGFCTAIANAVEKDIPVLVGLNDLNQSAFEAFAAGEAVHLAAQMDTLQAWIERVSRPLPDTVTAA
jgi:nucleoside-triphosphatase THEP1